MNLPNKITLSRICLIPIFVLIFFLNFTGNYLVAAIIFAIAAFTDALDGYIARSRGLVTNLGKFLDPIADKVLVSTAMILLLCMKETLFDPIFGNAATGIYVATAICVSVIMARELIISAFRQIAATTGLVMAADKLGKFKTIFQDVSIFFMLTGATFADNLAGQIIAYVGFVFFAIATLLTVVSGISYVVKNRQVLTMKTK